MVIEEWACKLAHPLWFYRGTVATNVHSCSWKVWGILQDHSWILLKFAAVWVAIDHNHLWGQHTRHCLKCSEEKVEDGSFRSQIQSTNLASEGYHQGSWSQQVYDAKWMLYVQLPIQICTTIRFYAPQDTELLKFFKASKILKSQGSIPTGTNSVRTAYLKWSEVPSSAMSTQSPRSSEFPIQFNALLLPPYPFYAGGIYSNTCRQPCLQWWPKVCIHHSKAMFTSLLCIHPSKAMRNMMMHLHTVQ